MKPKLIKAGDTRLKLGLNSQPPKVDCRVVSEYEYQRMIKLLKRAEVIIGNQGTNIACENWQNDYETWERDNLY